MIKQQFEAVGEESKEVQPSYHGHFSQNQGVFSIFLDLIEDIKSKISPEEKSSCNCFVKSSKGLANYVIKNPLPSETVLSEDLPDVSKLTDHIHTSNFRTKVHNTFFTQRGKRAHGMRRVHA